MLYPRIIPGIASGFTGGGSLLGSPRNDTWVMFQNFQNHNISGMILQDQTPGENGMFHLAVVLLLAEFEFKLLRKMIRTYRFLAQLKLHESQT